MPIPEGWDISEPLCGENDPYGREDTANKYAKTLWENFNAEHNSSDGSHTFDGDACVIETGTYQGTGIEHAIMLENSSLLVKQIFVTIGTSAAYPTFRRENKFSDLSTPGQFTVTTDSAVNASGVTYYFLIWGILS